MAVLCPSCGYDAPPSGPGAGLPCPGCGRKLIAVAPVKDDLIGTIVDDRFEVVATIAQGGMGRVYRAVQRSIGREIALKVIDRSVETDVAAVKRFFREAQLASQLSHPNTVSIIEFGQHADGRLYIAMELVRGRTLFDIVREGGALTPQRVARIGVQLCDALEAAHALSIIHRDLKLDNAMIVDGTRDHIKVLDFGLARSLVDPASRATVTGVIAGTPRYLAPEVVLRGADAAPSQDLYALGVMLGEMTVGRELWKSATLEGLLGLKLDGDPDLEGAHPMLAAVVEALVAVEPAQRPSPATVRARLLALEASLGVAAVAPPARLGKPPSLGIPSALDSGALMSLDDLPGNEIASPQPPPVPKPPPPSIPLPVVMHDNAPIMAAPVAPAAPTPATDEIPIDGALPKLEIETEWGAERQAKQQNAFPQPTRPARRGAHDGGNAFVRVVVLAIVLGLCGVGGYAWWQHRTRHVDEAVTAEQPGLGSAPHEVTIRVRGGADEVRLDGKLLGKPPITLTHRRDGALLMITAKFGDREVSQQVAADHDQDVDLEAP
jgi:serine/threonine protein kinase